MASSICFDDVTAVVIRKQNNQRSWASWKTSTYTPTHSHTRINKFLCCFAMPHIANPLTRQNITHTKAKHSNPPPLLSVTMCDCKNIQVFVPQVTQILAECEPMLMLDVESTLSAAHKCKVCILLFYSPTPLLSSFARKLWGRWPVPSAGFHFQYVEWQEAGESNRTHWRAYCKKRKT